MLFKDTYLTIENITEGVYKEKGSKFISNAFPITTQAQAKQYILGIKKMHHTAKHHCYAYCIGVTKDIVMFSDDAEPANTAGRPILRQIQSHNLTNILIVVSRYFGGTLLGVSGLINAYKNASIDAISNSKIIEKYVEDQYQLFFPYPVIGNVMKIIKQVNATILSQTSDLNCIVTVRCKKSISPQMTNLFNQINDVKIKYICSK